MTALLLAALLTAEPLADLKLTLKEQRETACGDTLACWKRKTLVLDTALESAIFLNDAQLVKLDFATIEIGLWKGKATDNAQALDSLKPALLAPTVQSSWLQSPTLWFGVGFVSAAAMAIGIFAVAKKIEQITQ